ncbi:hypothetical protein TNCV_3317281 [Trichonephila clavipes]|nr:hypothetical protein TNCV_3317281 [Trichonephila clavipes]
MVSVQHLLDQCRHRTTIVFGNLCRWPDRVTYYESEYPYTIFFETNFGVHVPLLSRGSFTVSPSVGGVSASKYESLPFGSHALHSTCGRVRDLVDVVGQLGNASKLEPTLACPQPWKRALETHVERSHQNALAHGMPSDGEPIEVSIASDGSGPQVITVNQAGLTSTIHEHERLVHAPLPMQYLPFCVRGKLSLMVVKGSEQQKIFLEPWRRCLNSTTPFPTPGMRAFRIAPSYQFAKYLKQFNKLQAEWTVSIL